jgi:hypothetical protein
MEEGCAMAELEEALVDQAQQGDAERVAARFAEAAAAEQLLHELLVQGRLGGADQAAVTESEGGVNGIGGGFGYEGKSGTGEQGPGGRRSVGGAAAIDAYLSGQW